MVSCFFFNQRPQPHLRGLGATATRTGATGLLPLTDGRGGGGVSRGISTGAAAAVSAGAEARSDGHGVGRLMPLSRVGFLWETVRT
jgi:hypothetical protein